MRTKIIALALMASACTNQDHSEQVLLGAGYTNIEMTGYSWLGCGENDQTHDGFRATGQDGRVVTGVVCCGAWSKGCTIRLE